MKRFELGLTALLLPLDLVGVVVSVYVANHLRTTLNILPLDGQRISYPGYYFLLWYFPMLVLFFAQNRLYILRETAKSVQQLFRVISGTASAAMLQFIIILFGRTPLIAKDWPLWYAWSDRISILTVFYFWILIIFCVTVLRWAYRVVINRLVRVGIGRRRLLIIGNSRIALDLLRVLKQRQNLGYEVLGVIATREISFDLPVIGQFSETEGLLKQLRPDEVLQADPEMDPEQVVPLIEWTHEIEAEYSFAPNLFEVFAANVRVTTLGNVPLLELRRTPLDGWGRILKRLLDVLVSIFLLVITIPITCVTALLIKLQDGGPVFFGQDRVSQGETFRILKFRSMIVDAEFLDDQLRAQRNERQDGPLFKMRDDPRVTPLGRFLRKSRIDELPQLINVLRGEMSLIGPRPHLPKEVARYQKHHRKVLTIKPGMTGVAQLSGSSDLSFDEEVRLDTYYIENWTLLRDIELLIKTPFVILFKDRSGS